MHSDKKSEEEALKERAVKTTIQILHAKGLFDIDCNADQVLNEYLIIERLKPDSDPNRHAKLLLNKSDPISDVVIQLFYS